MLTDEQIAEAQFEKFKKEVIAKVESTKYSDPHREMLFIYREEKYCKEHDTVHPKTVIMMHGNILFHKKALEVMSIKLMEHILGTDDNVFGEPDEN